MNGILLIDKEPGWTSNDVVSKLKGVLHERRIGHSGTLDPLATGLLTVFVGRATRAVQFAEGHDKRYIAGLRLGMSTDTQDITGKALRLSEVDCSETELREAVSGFIGSISQLPPMYSAIKINGQKLYDIARKGGEVERRARDISIYGIDIIGKNDDDWILDVRCSKGTYIRTLCNDIGDALGCGGCMSSLRRVSCGQFQIEDALTIGQVQQYAQQGKAEELLIPVDKLFSDAGMYTADASGEKKIRCGNDIRADVPDGLYRVYSESGEFLMLGRAEKSIMRTIKSFFEVC